MTRNIYFPITAITTSICYFLWISILNLNLRLKNPSLQVKKMISPEVSLVYITIHWKVDNSHCGFKMFNSQGGKHPSGTDKSTWIKLRQGNFSNKMLLKKNPLANRPESRKTSYCSALWCVGGKEKPLKHLLNFKNTKGQFGRLQQNAILPQEMWGKQKWQRMDFKWLNLEFITPNGNN